jgi:hypothetical protein
MACTSTVAGASPRVGESCASRPRSRPAGAPRRRPHFQTRNRACRARR